MTKETRERSGAIKAGSKDRVRGEDGEGVMRRVKGSVGVGVGVGVDVRAFQSRRKSKVGDNRRYLDACSIRCGCRSSLWLSQCIAATTSCKPPQSYSPIGWNASVAVFFYCLSRCPRHKWDIQGLLHMLSSALTPCLHCRHCTISVPGGWQVARYINALDERAETSCNA